MSYDGCFPLHQVYGLCGICIQPNQNVARFILETDPIWNLK